MFSSNRDNIEELHGDIAALKVTLALRDKEIERLTQPVGVEPLEVDGAGKYYYPLSGVPYDGKHYSTDAVARLIAERDIERTACDAATEHANTLWLERDALQEQLVKLTAQEPVAEVKMVDHIYRIHWKKCPPDDGTLLYDRPVPAAQAVPDGWLERGREALVEARRNEDLWEDDTLLAHLFAKMIAAAPKEHHQPPATDGEALLFEAEAKRSRP